MRYLFSRAKVLPERIQNKGIIFDILTKITREANEDAQLIVHRRLPSEGGYKWWFKTLCREQLHATTPEKCSLSLTNRLNDEILRWMGLFSWQLFQSVESPPKTRRPRIDTWNIGGCSNCVSTTHLGV